MTSWRNQAACRNEDPDLFHPDGTTGVWAAVIEEAQAICRRCPVIQQCAQWAIDTKQEHGIWGGYSETELRRIKRGGKPRNYSECGTRAGYKRHQKNRTTTCKPCHDANTAHLEELEQKKADEQQRIAERTAHMVRMADRGLPLKDVAARLGVSASLVTKTLRELRKQQLGEAA